ncbi:MAG: DUF1194 domain-containing protein [Hyphomicrobiaceae bacterium]
MLTGLAVCLVLVATVNTSCAAKDYVDLELVLAVDVSRSMDQDEQRLQREGYVTAFRDVQVQKAIRSGPNGRIAIAYVEWAGATIQSIVIPWRILGSKEDALALANELAAKPISRARRTSISSALRKSAELVKASPFQGLRRVIDVSGDGPNNSGGLVVSARDHVVASGIVINGLAIELAPGVGGYSYCGLPDLDRYYKDCVVGGAGSFVLSIRDQDEFATAIRQKLLLEIAGLAPRRPPVLQRAQFQPPTEEYDCLVGEKRLRQYLNEREDW